MKTHILHHPSIDPGSSIFRSQMKQDATPESVPTTIPPQTVLDLLGDQRQVYKVPRSPYGTRMKTHMATELIPVLYCIITLQQSNIAQYYLRSNKKNHIHLRTYAHTSAHTHKAGPSQPCWPLHSFHVWMPHRTVNRCNMIPLKSRYCELSKFHRGHVLTLLETSVYINKLTNYIRTYEYNRYMIQWTYSCIEICFPSPSQFTLSYPEGSLSLHVVGLVLPRHLILSTS